jgi:histidine ammonia-lyase
MNKFTITSAPLTLDDIRQFLNGCDRIILDSDTLQRVQANRDFLERKLAVPHAQYYGINTGFGALCDVPIAPELLEQLQYNLIMSHACGMGDEVIEPVVRLMMLLKVKGLSLGYSGITVETLTQITTLYNQGILPIVYEIGSLGASGDLAPLAHLCLPMIGMGEVRHQGQVKPAATALGDAGISPVALRSKEGLALLNGTQFMSAWGSYLLVHAERLAALADLCAAVSFDAFDARIDSLHPAIHRVRRHAGQIQSAARIASHLDGSAIAHHHKQAVQDPYAFRCAPQVHGAALSVIAHVRGVFENEINAVTDNPLIVAEDDLIVSGGNFHGEPLALAFDYLGLALCELASISERRVFQLLSGKRGLPKFLVADSGLQSGFMIPQYTAAAMVSANKQLATPASVDSIPSSDGQEDHVSMGANAAIKTHKILLNLERVLAIEWLNAMQALDFRAPAHSSPFIEQQRAAYRAIVPHYTQDRIMYTDMERSVAFTRALQL